MAIIGNYNRVLAPLNIAPRINERTKIRFIMCHDLSHWTNALDTYKSNAGMAKVDKIAIFFGVLF